jgi:hypothetical protein
MIPQSSIQRAIDHLRSQGTVFEAGLSNAEVMSLEIALRLRFPPDLRAFLQTALPVSGDFPNWRAEQQLPER